MITQELDQGTPILIGDSKGELIKYLKKQRQVDFDEDKIQPRPDGKWQYRAIKSKKKK